MIIGGQLGDRTAGDSRADTADAAVLADLAARVHERISGENFPVALRLLPRTVRADLAAVYCFARFVDEVGDSAPGGPAVRLALLDLVERDVHELPAGRTQLAPVAGMRDLVTARVPLQPLLDLIAANRLDQHRATYATFDDLLDYCRLSAAPVGRIVLHLAGRADERTIPLSDDVCAALQVLEHCQDVGEDHRAGRVYLPAQDLAGRGVPDSALAAATTTPALRAVVADQVRRSRQLLDSGPPLVAALDGWARRAVAGYVAGGQATADALDAAGHEVLASTVRPSKARTARHAVRLLRTARKSAR